MSVPVQINPPWPFEEAKLDKFAFFPILFSTPPPHHLYFNNLWSWNKECPLKWERRLQLYCIPYFAQALYEKWFWYGLYPLMTVNRFPEYFWCPIIWKLVEEWRLFSKKFFRGKKWWGCAANSIAHTAISFISVQFVGFVLNKKAVHCVILDRKSWIMVNIKHTFRRDGSAPHNTNKWHGYLILMNSVPSFDFVVLLFSFGNHFVCSLHGFIIKEQAWTTQWSCGSKTGYYCFKCGAVLWWYVLLLFSFCFNKINLLMPTCAWNVGA
jgi:hypothetical protein